MSFTPEGLENNKINASSKVTKLNPNATEFVPSSRRTTYGNIKDTYSSRVDSIEASKNAVLGRAESSLSNNSLDDDHQYWHLQLPNDITPDFKAMGEDNECRLHQLSLVGLSVNDGLEQSRFSAPITSEALGTQNVRAPFGMNNLILRGRKGYHGSPYNENQLSTARVSSASNSWDRQFLNGDKQLSRVMGRTEGQDFIGDSGTSSVNNMLGDQPVMKSAEIKMLEALSFHFPGFSAETLADIYYANGYDLDSTIEMLGQLKAATNFASPPREVSPEDIPHWNHRKYGSPDGSTGSSRSLHFISSTFNGHKSPSVSASRVAPVWPEAGEAVANVELREEVRDLAGLRDACLEQASQAYLIGNKALAKELSEKGQFYNMQMKAAKLKAGNTIYQKRNAVPYGAQGNLIDLNGLHLSDALQVLKHEINILSSTARSCGQQLQASIFLGTPVSERIVLACEQFLLEEGLPFTRPRPGLLHVVIY
ncbi:polyadenylate-binding protein-interacting protein 7-like isoform X2 [Asparagus officinalis]|uniref:polyadenylate-binding protein-interacting protein 7-like isoform X2 n=1 Tax=Asparagus officinalis TaxID=4686 RepID=UPI00098E118F|nr:polyadenylate-binding protein-interacting protein 7-like isoform X2 [Asparagus officinalis]